MPDAQFNRYYDYAGLTDLLKSYAAEFPQLVNISSIGKSHEGRDIWLATVTNTSTGSHQEKPALWADGNIHATELSASTAVLHLLDKLCRNFGQRPDITRALDTRTFYLCPRLNPDGAEWAMEIPPRAIRSSTRRWPDLHDDHEGVEPKDLDGDGRILSMRIKDSNGPWKVSPLNPRLLTRRDPGEAGGNYYRLLPEGLFHNFDGMTMRERKNSERLDINRNYPGGWRPEGEQVGAGPYPTSEPEVRAMVQAVIDRPNICGGVCFHTFSGVNLRPSSRKSDDDMPAEDIWTFKKIGEAGEKITGYPAISVFHDFRYHPKEVITGTQDDWLYEHQGVYAWTTEIWSPQRQAGITDYKYIDWYREHPPEDDVKLLDWSDQKLGGRGYVDWKPFQHPQLGEVEIGGWDSSFAFRNPPPEFLEAEVAPLGDWLIWQALASPKLEFRECVVSPAGTGASRIRLTVQNSGYLPTNVTKHAEVAKLVTGVIAEISRENSPLLGMGHPEPSWLIAGEVRQDAGQLNGWNHVGAGGFGFHSDPTDDVALFEWVVTAGTYSFEVHHPRAGVVRHSLTI